MLNRPSEYKKMYEMEEKHWWYQCLHKKIILMVTKLYGSNKEIKILDAGCGTGGLIKKFISEGYKDVKGFDISDIAVKFCRDRGLDVHQSDLLTAPDELCGESFDVIILNDVLYFISEDDWKVLTKKLYSILVEDGIVILNLPVHTFLSAKHDMAVGIKRRFRKNDINKIICRSKYSIIKIEFWPFALFPIIFLVRMTQRLRMNIEKNTIIVSDTKLPSPYLNKILYIMSCMTSGLSNYFQFGSSMLLAVKKNK